MVCQQVGVCVRCGRRVGTPSISLPFRSVGLFLLSLLLFSVLNFFFFISICSHFFSFFPFQVACPLQSAIGTKILRLINRRSYLFHWHYRCTHVLSMYKCTRTFCIPCIRRLVFPELTVHLPPFLFRKPPLPYCFFFLLNYQGLQLIVLGNSNCRELKGHPFKTL